MAAINEANPLRRRELTPYRPSEFHHFKAPDWLIDGVVAEKSLCAVYGPSQAGKSALVLEIVRALTTGSKWFDRETRKCGVFYAALEGAAGVRHRVMAAEKHFGVSMEQAHFLFEPLDLRNPEKVKTLTDRINECGDIGLTIIDTMACAMSGADENSFKEIGLVLEGLEAIRKATGAAVLVVAHTGKDVTRGMRGHSSLFAALDYVIKVMRKEGYRRWTQDKARDGADGAWGSFDLLPVVLGEDSRGRPLTSIVVEPMETGDEVAPVEVKLGKNQQVAMTVIAAKLAELIGQEGEDASLTEAAAVELARGVMAGDDKHKKERAKEAVKGLHKLGQILIVDGMVSLPAPDDE